MNNTNQIDFFKNTVFNKVSEETEEEFKVRQELTDLTSANELARVPRRFWAVKAEDFNFGFDLKSFVKESKNTAGVCLMSGMTGRGKTTAEACAIHERARLGYPVGLYFSNLLLSQQIRSTRSFSAKENEFEFYERLGRVPFLCLDEVGTAQDYNEERMFLRTILMLRYDNNVPTMIATNLTNSQFIKFILGIPIQNEVEKEKLKELSKTDPVMNRLNSVITSVVMVGESLR